MGKLSYNDKQCMQMLREQGLGEKAIISSYADKRWKLTLLRKSAVESTTLAQPFCVNQAVRDLPQHLYACTVCRCKTIFPLVGPTKF